jgi:hypothetical protein
MPNKKLSNSLRTRAFLRKEGISCQKIYHGNGFMGIILGREEDEKFEIGMKIIDFVRRFETESIFVFRHFFSDLSDYRNGPYAVLAFWDGCGKVHPWDCKGDCEDKGHGIKTGTVLESSL